jgi:hypothetical protein
MVAISDNTTPRPIHPREKYVIQGHIFDTSENLHNCAEIRIAIGKFSSSEEFLDVAPQDEINGNQIR